MDNEEEMLEPDELNEGPEELNEPEMLDETPEYSQGDLQDQAVSQPKFGEEAYLRKGFNKDYYKDERERLKSEKEDLTQKTAETAANRRAANEAKKAAKAEKKSATGDDKKSAKEQYKARKKEAKEAKAADREAKSKLRSTKANLMHNKINNFSSKAYQAAHPIDAFKKKYDPRNEIRNVKEKAKDKAKTFAKDTAKKAAKATGKAVKKGATTVGKAASAGLKALASQPAFWIVLGIIAIVAALAIAVTVLFGALSGEMSSGIGNASVDYNINGVNSETTISILNDQGIAVATVPFEKYIAGVAIYRLGKDATEEALKTEIVLLRSYLLAVGVTDEANNTITVTNVEGNFELSGENAQTVGANNFVYWDYQKPLYRTELSPGTYIFSPAYTPGNNETPYYTALTSEEVLKYEMVISSVMGVYTTDSEGNPYKPDLSKDQELIESAQANAGTDNGSYPALIMKLYPEATETKQADYEMIYYGEIGEFSTWKQKTKLGAPWGDVLLGTSSATKIDKIGCLVTSIAMQVAYSGVPTGTITDFNPGSLATAMRKQGCFSSGGGLNSYDCVSKVVPDFKYYTSTTLSGSNSERYLKLKAFAEKGYFMVVEVRKHNGGQHWIAVDVQNSALTNWTDIYMWDPATKKIKFSEAIQYKPNKVVLYKKNN